MAVVTTTIIPEPFPFPYTTLAQPRIDTSNVPLGETQFFSVSETVALSPAGDTQQFRLDMFLPNNYAYVLLEVVVSILADKDANWESSFFGFMKNSDASSIHRTQFPIEFASLAESPASGAFTRRFYRPLILPKGIWRSHPGSLSQCLLEIEGECLTLEQPDMYLGFYARFNQYNIRQASDAAVNLPILTR